MSDDVVEDPVEWFRVMLEIGTKDDSEPPLVAAVGWATDIGEMSAEKDIGTALARVLRAASTMHGAGIMVLWVLAHAVRESQWDGQIAGEENDEKAFILAAANLVAKIKKEHDDYNAKMEHPVTPSE